MRNQLPLLMPPTTSLLSMECSVFFTLDLSEPKRHEAEMENERLRFHERSKPVKSPLTVSASISQYLLNGALAVRRTVRRSPLRNERCSEA